MTITTCIRSMSSLLSAVKQDPNIQSSEILDINLKVSSCVCGSVEGMGMGLFHEYKLRLKESRGGSKIT